MNNRNTKTNELDARVHKSMKFYRPINFSLKFCLSKRRVLDKKKRKVHKELMTKQQILLNFPIWCLTLVEGGDVLASHQNTQTSLFVSEHFTRTLFDHDFHYRIQPAVFFGFIHRAPEMNNKFDLD